MNNFITNPVQALVDETNAWQKSMRDSANASNTNKILDDAKTMYQSGLDVSDSKTKNSYLSGSNLNSLAGAIISYAETKGKYDEYASLKEPSQIIDKFLGKNPGRGYEEWINQFTGGKIGFDDVTRKIGINNRVNPYLLSEDVDDEEFDPSILSDYDQEELDSGLSNNSKRNSAGKTAIGLASLGLGGLATDLGLNWLGKGMSRYGNRMLEKDNQFLPTDKVANYQIEYGGTKRLYEDDLKIAQNELKRIESEGGDTTSIKNEIKKINKAIEDLDKGKSPRTIYDTAKDYGLGKFSNKTLSEQGAAEEAVKIRKKIFRDYLNPIFKKNNTTLNIKEIVDSLEDVVEGIVEPGKQSDAFDAVEALKEEFQGERFTAMTPDKVQQLKSELYDEVPEKAWKGKPIANAYNAMKVELAKKIRKAELDIIDKAIKNGDVPEMPKSGMFKGKDARTLFFDYDNLDEIKRRGAKSLTNPTKMPEVIDKIPIIGELTSPIGDVKTPTSRGFANTMIKRGDALKNNTLGKGAKKIFSQFSDVLGKIGKATKVEDPAGIIGLMQLYFEGIDALLGKSEGGYGKEASNALEQMPVKEVENAITQMEDFYTTWDYMRDEDRIQTIVDMRKEFGKDVSFEDAKYSYEKWKGNSGGGSFKLFWGDGNFPLYKSTDDINKNFRPNENIPETAYKVLYQQAKTDEEKIKLIMDRYGVDEKKAKDMLPRMTMAGEYNTEYIDDGDAFPSGIYITEGQVV